MRLAQFLQKLLRVACGLYSVMSKRDFIRDVGIIGCANLVVSLGQFAFLPLVAKYLGAFGYGIWAQINATLGVVGLVSTLGLDFSFVRFYSSVDDRAKLGRGFFTILAFLLLWGGVLGVLFYVFSRGIALFVFGEASLVLLPKIMAFIVPLAAVNALFFFYFRARRRIKMYALLSVFQFFADLALISVCVGILSYGVYSIAVSMLIVRGIVFLALFLIICRDIPFSRPVFSDLPQQLKFSLPLIPSEMSNWITNYSDRYFIVYFLGVESAGIYAAAYGIGRIISAFALPLNFVLLPTLSRLYDKGEIDSLKRYLAHSLKYLFLGAIPAVFGLLALSKPILALLTKPEFVGGYYIIPIVGSAMLFVCSNAIYGQIFALNKKNHVQGAISISAGLLNFSLNLIAIPHWGLLGAAITTFLAFALSNILTIFLTRKYISFSVDWPAILKSLAAAVLMLLIVYSIRPISVLGLGMSVLAGVAVYVLAIRTLGVITDKEIASFREAVIS